MSIYEKIKNIVILIKSLINIRIYSSTNLGNELVGKTVLISTVRQFVVPLVTEFFLARLITNAGGKVILLIDDFQLEHWDTFSIHEEKWLKAWDSKLFRMMVLIKKEIIKFILKNKNIKVINLSTVTDDKLISINIDENDERHALASVSRYFGRAAINLKNKEEFDYYNLSINNIKLIKYVSRKIFESCKVDGLITSHGIYSLWGAIYDEAKVKNIETIIYGLNSYKNSEITILNKFYHEYDWNEILAENRIDEKINSNNVNISEIMNKRLRMIAEDSKKFYEGKLNIISTNKDKKNILICPNVVWDGDIPERHRIFENSVNWLYESILLSQKYNLNLYIRYHPAEKGVYKGSKSLYDLLIEKHPDILRSQNVFHIKSDEKINLYKFLSEEIDLLLVYDGILILEGAYLGLEVVECGTSRFGWMPSIHRPNDKFEFESIFESLYNGTLIKRADKSITEEAMNWYLKSSSFSVPFLGINKHGFYDLFIDRTKNSESIYKDSIRIICRIKNLIE